MQQLHLPKLILVLSLILSSLFAFALEEAPQAFTLDGTLYAGSSAKTPLLDTGILKIQILDYNGTCVLYEEQQTFDTRGSAGAFNINIGEKVSANLKRTSGDSGNTLAKVFANNGGTIPGKLLSNGSACTGPATVGYHRLIRITVVPDSDPTPRVMDPFELNSVPSAIVAERAESLDGIAASGFLQTRATAPYSLSQSNLENIFSTANYSKLTDLLSGSSLTYVHSGANGTIQAPAISGTPSSPAAGQVWYDSGVIKYYDGSSAQTLSAGSGVTSLIIGAGLTPTGTISSGGQTIAVDTGTTAGKIVAVQAGGKLPALDGSDLTNVTASAFSSTGSISTSGSVSANAANFRSLTLTNAGSESITLNPAASITGSPIAFTLPAAMPASNGYVLSSNTSGVMSWIAPATGGLSGVSNTASLAQGKTWIGDASGLAQEKFIGIADIRSSQAGNAQFFPGSACSTGQTLAWQSGTDTLVCSNISLATSALTGSINLASQVTGTLPVANGGTNSATALNNNRLIVSSGGAIVEASAMTDGQIVVGKTSDAPQLVTMSGDATISNTGAVTLKNTGTAGTYAKVTTDSQGRVTAGTTLSASDIPNLDWAKITSGKPTTLSGYGITNAITNAGDTVSFQSGVDASKPAAGTAGRVYLATDTSKIYRDNGTTWDTIASNSGTGISALTGDVTASGSGSVAATVANVGGVTAANVASGATAANAATNSNTVATIVKRDSNGDFSARDANLNSLIIRGSSSGTLTQQVPATTTSYSVTWPSAAPSVTGYVLSSDTAGNLSWVAPATGGLTAVSNTANLVNGKIWIGDAGGKSQEQVVSGDITLSNAGATKVVALQNTAVSATAPTTTGQVLRNVSGTWTPGFVSMVDLRSNATGATALAASCASNQTLTYNSAMDNLTCSNIALPTSQLSGALSLTSQVTDTLPVANGGTGLTSGTSGGIPYFSAAGTLASSAELTQYQVLLGGGTGAAPTVVSGTGTSGQVLTSNGAGAAPTWQNASGGGSSQWATSGSDVSYTTGNVGIGITTPNANLEISSNMSTTYSEGNLPVTPRIKITNSNTTNNTTSELNLAANDLGGGNSVSGVRLVGIFTSHVASALSADFAIVTRNAGTPNEAMRVAANGNVGIGTTTPGSGTALNVNGQIRSGSASTTTGTIDWSTGNAITTSYNCASSLTFANLRDGGSYTLVVTNTGTTQCSFSTTTTGDDAATVTYRFSPANATRFASTHTLYSFTRIGTVVYVSWISGM